MAGFSRKNVQTALICWYPQILLLAGSRKAHPSARMYAWHGTRQLSHNFRTLHFCPYLPINCRCIVFIFKLQLNFGKLYCGQENKPKFNSNLIFLLLSWVNWLYQICNELSQHSVASLNLLGFIKSCSIDSRNEQSPTCEEVHETKAHFRNILPNRFLPSSIVRALES